ncbi:MAG: hypothetical protein EA341_04290 [Mongoliibacter sp.]|uniref:hypothetical protein n=1 Tax=Mongoliibacter sp. TaxID=2022438 RepID=UPI0012F2EDE3|nr:hypothetical protein [Mongoliibacter sp.]TVP51827.1 MAG: hypothetical protein EA341_04290 [Mongoliibacter sp.]
MNPFTQITKQKGFRKILLSALFGGAIPFFGLLTIILTKEDHFESWMLIPLTIIPAGGTFAGAFFYLMGFYWSPTGNRKLVSIISSTILYFVVLWISAVMAFAITGHWD